MKKLIFISSFFWTYTLCAQVQGKILRLQDKKPIKQASVRLASNQTTVVTDETGRFEIALGKQFPDTLFFKAKGYVSDTLVVTKEDRFIGLEVVLINENDIDEVFITFKRESKTISRLKPILVETLGEGELKKAACCNLSESFETNATVDVNMTDAVSGAKKIQLLGLDGVYTQLQMENIPFLTGVEGSFGMNTVPGTWVESIQITKGTGSVVNGYESMAGLINVEFRKPSTMPKLAVNAYLNQFGRAELNLHGAQQLNERWKTGSFAHVSGMQQEIDNNNDGFRDVPFSKTASVLNRWEYDGKKFEARFGVNAYYDQRDGGQLRSITAPYLANSANKHIDVFAKTGFLFPDKPYRSLGIVYQLKYHDLGGQMGNRQFSGVEKRAYINAIYDGIFGNTTHKYKTGLSFVAQDLTQAVDTFSLNRVVYTPGLFFEYTYTGTRLVAVVGARADFQEKYGNQFSPRVHLKYILDEQTDLRITTGRAFRLANPIVDNTSLLATNKHWVLPKETQQEVVWNSGVSLVRTMRWWKRAASLSLDFYHARFRNQLVIDREQSMDTFYFAFQQNSAFSNAFQAELSFQPVQPLTIRLAYKWLEVKANYNGKLQQQVMIPPHRILVNAAYATRNKKWEFDATLSVFSKVRLHDVELPTGEVLHHQYGKVFPMVLAQVTYHFRKFDAYIGGENLANYRQANPIVSAQDPTTLQFDATRVYAPILGRLMYIGFRYELKNKK